MSVDPGLNQGAIYAAMAAAEGQDFPADDGHGGGGDSFSHAPGRICLNCDRQITDRQPARRKGADGWVHDVCPAF